MNSFFTCGFKAKVLATIILFLGFKISNTSCCNVDTSVGGLCLPNSNLCKNRTEYVFWDAFHPTDAANAVLADRIFTTLFHEGSSPAPAPYPRKFLKP